MSDELRSQLRRLDPVRPDEAMEPIPNSRLERIMTNDPTTAERAPSPGFRLALVGGVAVVALVAAFVVPGLLGGSTADPLVLGLAADDAMASCLPVTAEFMADMSPAFEGTVTAVEGETVTLTFDLWFAGDTGATEAELTAPAGMEALIGGVEFSVGETYLITASGGTVNYCGYSGPATPELRAIFEAAFGA
jgi:hypothetical protein